MAAASTAPPLTQVGRASARPSARRLFRTVHLVLGLSFGLLLVFQGLSGAALVWRPELDRLLLPSLTRTTPPAGTAAASSLAQGLATVKATVPDGTVRQVRLPLASNGTDEWMVQLPARAGQPGDGARWTIYTAPATGQLLGIRGNRRDALQFLVELHHNLLWGRTGRAILGYLALATMLLSLSGLWLWWPVSWRAARMRPRASVRPLHYSLGFWAMAPLLLISTTATYFVWRQPIQHAFGLPDDRRPAQNPTEIAAGAHKHGAHADTPHTTPAPNTPSPLDAVLAAAHTAEPNARLTGIRLPEGDHGPYTVQFESASENYRAAPNSMLIRPGGPSGTAQVLKVTRWRDLPTRRRFLEWLPRLHQGEFGGPLIRLLWSFTGFMPAVLFVSGFLMWRRRLRAAG